MRPQVAGKINDFLAGKEGIRRDAATGDVAPDTDAANVENKTYFFHIGSGVGGGEQDQYVIGTKAQLIDELTIPRWDPQGRPRALDVDHKRELQLGGAADAIENFWLLDASANRSAGSRIRNAIESGIRTAAQADPRWSAPKTRAEIQAMGVPIVIDLVEAGGDLAGSPDSRWDYEKVIDPTAADGPGSKLTNVTASQLRSAGLLGAPTRLVIYPASGGRRKEVPGWDAQRGERGLWADFIRGIRQAHVRYQPGAGGDEFSGIIEQRYRGRLLIRKEIHAALTEVAGLPFTTVIDRADLTQSMRFAELNGMSPVEFTEVGVDAARGLQARGVVRPTIPVLRRGMEIDILLDGDDLQLSKTFTKDDFAFPGPIRVTQAALTVGIGTESGLFVDGSVDFEIPRLGQGQIGARASTGNGFELRGSFNFDSTLFDPARITAEYREGRLSASGEIGIREGRVRGIRSANLRVEIDGENVTATGTVRPAVPGVERGDLTVRYTPEAGLAITGRLELASNIPGIQSGSLTAEVTKPPNADRWSVTATGEAVPRIPGVATRLLITYADGAFDINGTAAYERGMLSGSITVGATNRPLGPDGQPAGAPPEGAARQIVLYGGGSLTLRLAPWLQATAGVRLLPNGEIEVSGEIALPAALDLFPQKRFDRNILTIGIDIPIVGVAVAGQRIGIFANISGGLDLSAGIGPGQLQELRLGVTYNPAHEDQTRITGGARLHIPAQAGLRLFVRGSLGVGIPVVSASAGIELGGALGIEGALDASVDVDWSPSTGLDIQAMAEIYAEPVFRFDITGFVMVEADLLFTTIELYSKRWQLASFEYGSGLRLGLRFPIHYHEGQPFDVALSDIEFQVPNIDPGATLRGLIGRIA